MDGPLADISYKLHNRGIPFNPIPVGERALTEGEFLEVPIGHREELVLWERPHQEGTFDGPEPPVIDISHHTWEGNDVTAGHVHVTLAHVSSLLAAEFTKTAYEYYLEVPETPAAQEIFSELVALRMQNSADPKMVGYQEGLLAAFAALTGRNVERLHEEVEEAAQAAHEEMIASRGCEF